MEEQKLKTFIDIQCEVNEDNTISIPKEYKIVLGEENKYLLKKVEKTEDEK